MLWFGGTSVRAAPAPGLMTSLARVVASGQESGQGLLLSPGYRPGRLVLRDDRAHRLQRALVELARRKNGRRMIERILRSGFVTVLASSPLRARLAGLWGPIAFHQRIVGAVLYLDMRKILGLDHDPSGVETLAHELRHQVDASRAFRAGLGNAGIHSAALAGDQTRSAQRFGHRVRLQRPDISAQEARRWLAPRIVTDERSPWSRLPRGAARTTAY